jgi:hypothetical protein
MLQKFGFQFDPFTHLDSTKDARLYEYLVIPKTVEIAWGDEPAAILARPGGGKSALRAYTEQVYRGTRGVKLPITYIPETYSTESQFHFLGLQRALARALLIYLISYPDVFLQLSSEPQSKTKSLLSFLPYDFDFLLSVLEGTDSVSEMEQLLGVNALSGIQKIGESHQRMTRQLRVAPAAPLHSLTIDILLAHAREIFEIDSFHILVDGLDGFVETTPPEALSQWLAPLMEFAEIWKKQKIYLKFFLPVSMAEFPHIARHRGIRTATLNWDDSLLAEVIRRRLYVASQGAFDSLDAISTPDLRNIELHLARQLNAEQKLPRQIILKTRHLLEKAQQNPDWVIHYEDVFEEARDVSESLI